MKKNKHVEYRFTSILSLIFFFFIGVMVTVYFIVVLYKPTIKHLSLLTLGIFALIVYIIKYIRYTIVIDNRGISVQTEFRKKNLLWDEIGWIVEDSIWPFNKMNLSVYWLIPKPASGHKPTHPPRLLGRL